MSSTSAAVTLECPTLDDNNMMTENPAVTLIAHDGGRMQLSEAAARQSTKLTAWLDHNPEQREIVATEVVDDERHHMALTTSVLQHLADILEHFVTHPYPPMVKPNPDVPTWDDIGGQWLGNRLRHMRVMQVERVCQASLAFGCEQLMSLTGSYLAYRLRTVQVSIDPVRGGLAENSDRQCELYYSASIVTP